MKAALKNGIMFAGLMTLFSILSFWKFSDLLFIEGKCLTNSGDGIGTIAMIHSTGEAVRAGKVSLFGEEFFSNKEEGFGTLRLIFNVFWGIQDWLLTEAASADNVYDLLGLVSSILIFTAGLFLASEMGLGFVFSVIFGLILANADAFYCRMSGHLHGLGAYYVPIFLIWATLRASKNPTFSRLIILSILQVINFLANEYYGYFGVIFSAILFFPLLSYHGQMRKGILKKLLGAFALFIILMSLFYPSLVGARLLSFFNLNNKNSLLKGISHGFGDFAYYTLKNPFFLFRPGLSRVASIFRADLFENLIGEVTFRVGLMVPLILFAVPIYFKISKFCQRFNQESIAAVTYALCWLPAILTSVFFALSPEHCFSLVKLTYRIAPMFRVGARSLLYFDIAVFLLACYMLDLSFRWNLAEFKIRHPGPLPCIRFLSILLVAIFLIIDSTGTRVISKISTLELPKLDAYKVLPGKEKGLLLELPYITPTRADPADGYIYYYARTLIHRMPLVNFGYVNDSAYIAKMDRFADYVNNISKDKVEELAEHGLRYIVVHKNTLYDFSSLKVMKQLKLLSESDGIAVYKLVRQRNRQSQPKDFLSFYWK